jgi:hypothetical protein
MPVSRITNWNGEEIEAIQTKGGVWAFPNYLNGVICSNDCCSPPPELVQKLAKSDKYIHFYPEDQPLITRQLGYYTDLQSAHSEDAMVWSCFGTAADCLQDVRTVWGQWLVKKLGYNETITKTTICLWRRVPHPDNFTQGGPELDALIQTDKVVILVEAKWRSGESRWQGIDGRSSQFDLRERFIRVLGSAVYGERRVILLSIVLEGNADSRPVQEGIDFHRITWKTLVNEGPHPRAGELRRYYDWKRNLIPRKYGVEPPG